MTEGEDWRHEFVRLLSSARQEDRERALAMRLAHVPATLFRYRRPTASAIENVRRGTIWLSAANKFNDLFDTSVRVDFLAGMKTLLRQQIASRTLALPQEMLSQLENADDPVETLDEIFASEVAKQDPDAAERAKGFFTNFAQARSEDTTAKASEFFQRATKVACLRISRDGDRPFRGIVTTCFAPSCPSISPS